MGLFRRFLCCLGMGLFTIVISSMLIFVIAVAIFIALTPPDGEMHWTWDVSPIEIIGMISIATMIIYWFILKREE